MCRRLRWTAKRPPLGCLAAAWSVACYDMDTVKRDLFSFTLLCFALLSLLLVAE
jgi:hypothetical protein